MYPFKEFNKQNSNSKHLTLNNLEPTPEEEWQRMYKFVNLEQTDIDAMLETVEPLFKRGHELVVGNYDYLLKNHDTAVILGWERGADEKHLSERRRFMTVWLARTLGLDFSDDFARYLFRAGQIHAGHGPRQIHVPDIYITGAISLVNATFARFLSEEMPNETIVPTALAGWNKMLSMHLHMMIHGYYIARALDHGDFPVNISLFGKMRNLTGHKTFQVHLPIGASIETLLQKFFNYFPHARQDVFDINWLGGERLDTTGTPWFTTERIYRVKPMWRVLLNGRNVDYIGGLSISVSPNDHVSIFPPGR